MAWLLRHWTRPLLLSLHARAARIPFPVAEPLAFALALLTAAALAMALLRAARQRLLAPLLRWLRGVGWTALLLATALALTWFPTMAQPLEAPPVPKPDRLEWLCGELIDALNASALAFPTAEESLRLAPEAAGLIHGAVKAARYPEWMRVAAVSGLFVPLTGEAIVDATASPALIPFTAVHELAHLLGVADEGAANILAWRRCMEAGGAFADSARLWALRYAMGLLLPADGAAWQRMRGKMKDPLAQVYRSSGGEALARGAVRGLPRLSPTRGDYAALVGWLADGGIESRYAGTAR